MYVLKLKNLVTMLLFVFVLCFSCLCSAGITFQADGGKNFLLDFNNKNGCGQYVLLDASGNIVFTFDFDSNSQEFTTYRADGSLLAIRKMLSWDRMLHKDQPHHDFIVCVRRGDGDYYRENYSSPSFYEHTPKAFNTFLQNKEYFSVKPSAGISFQADGGKNFVLDFNNKNSCGRYVLLDASGNIVFTFDFDSNSQEFTTYRADGSLLAIRKMLSWDRMLHKDQPHHDFIVCVRRGDGDYYRENYSSPSFYEHTPKAFNTFLQNKEYFGVR